MKKAYKKGKKGLDNFRSRDVGNYKFKDKKGKGKGKGGKKGKHKHKHNEDEVVDGLSGMDAPDIMDVDKEVGDEEGNDANDFFDGSNQPDEREQESLDKQDSLAMTSPKAMKKSLKKTIEHNLPSDIRM